MRRLIWRPPFIIQYFTCVADTTQKFLFRCQTSQWNIQYESRSFLYSLRQLKCLYKENGVYENSLITKRCRLQEKLNVFCLSLKVSNEFETDNQKRVVGFMGRHKRFKEIYCLNLQLWKWKQYVAPKRCYLSRSPQGVTDQKANINRDSEVKSFRFFLE